MLPRLCRKLCLTLRGREVLQKFHRYQRTDESSPLDRLGQAIAQVGIKMLFVMCGEIQTLVAVGFGKVLNSFHQLPAIALSTEGLGNHHGLHKQTVRLANHTG